SIERADTRPAAPSEPPAGPAAVEPLQLLPDWGPPVPLSAPPPEARSRRSRPEKSTSRGSSRRAGDPTEQPAPAAAAPAEPPQDETASAPPPVGLTLKESADRPPALTVDSVAPPRLTAAIPAPRAQPEGGIAPVLDAVKELVRAG
ncbi:MAG TPA: hypothetical protein VHG69_09570, partial [Thermoleophilaceae bacterium]|nr:hypothetical protein [Thermoleophilaceae bacterium]